MSFLTNLGVIGILCSFRLVLEGKVGTEKPVSSRLEFLEKFSANNFAISDAEEIKHQNFPMEGNAQKKKILRLEEINKSKRIGLCE